MTKLQLDKTSCNETQSGFALIVVLWVAGLIAALMGGFAIKVRIDALASANALRSSQTEMAADGMARLTAWRLAAGTYDAAKNGTPVSCKWNDQMTVSIQVQDQAGLADLNTLSPQFFSLLFQRLGSSSQEADKLATSMADFRDTDSQSTDGGPERVTYAGQVFGPKNSPFQTIEEMDQLPGMTDALYRAALPLVTVHASQPGIDPVTAPSELRETFDETTDGVFTGPLAPYQGPQQGKSFGIDIRVTASNGSRFRRKTVAVIFQQPDKPFALLEWQRGGAWESDPKGTAPCFN